MQENSDYYFDAHTHLLDYPPSCISDIILQAQKHHFVHIAVNTTTQLQYCPLLELRQKYPFFIVPSFGIHPLFIKQQEDINASNQGGSWIETLKKYVLENEGNCIGEIGIDFRTFVLEENSKEQQLEYFEKQLDLAIQLNRPATIHCVRAYGQLLKILKNVNKKLISPITIILHSYGGSKEITKSLLKLSKVKIYFSLSLQATHSLSSVIPLDCLLCQTDSPCQNNQKLLEETNLTQLNQYHIQNCSQLEKSNKMLFQRALGNIKQEEGQDSKEDESNEFYKRIMRKQTNQPTNLIASTKILHQSYNIDESTFVKAIFDNACKAFRLIK